ncbi:hypothetical protein [Sutterella wadsworthensis]|uniref:hypothetical protein n=1 Tax=Sutterella wadsworthensis TaxID=40545 RepID=UPI002670E85A|nr:hypothetical protein [Sutterella wadsworthensis]
MDLLKRRRPLAKSFRPASEASADCLALWRPAWEVGPVLWHMTASAFALGLWSCGVLSGMPALVLGGIPAGLALKRITEAQRIWQERSRLSGHAPAFMSFADLALVMRSFETPRLSPDEPRSAIRQTGMTRAAAIRLIGADPGTLFHAPAEAPVQSVWFGLGFRWTPVEAQRLYELTRIDWKSMLLPERWRHWFAQHPGLSDASPGIPVLHGVGPSPVCPPWQRGRIEEEPGIIRPLSSLGGGTLLVGTTQTGKGVVLTNLVSQAILRGDAVIVIDPKSSKRLRSAVIGACRAAGRPEPLEFHPAFPKRGVRLNPLGSYTRSTEIASRICAVLPRGGGAFTAFAWRAVFVMTEGMLFVGQPPTLRRFRAALERGIEELLEAAPARIWLSASPFGKSASRHSSCSSRGRSECRWGRAAGRSSQPWLCFGSAQQVPQERNTAPGRPKRRSKGFSPFIATAGSIMRRSPRRFSRHFPCSQPEHWAKVSRRNLISRAKPTIRGPSFRSKT